MPRMSGHTEFWVAVATISPLAIATNLITLGPVMANREAIPRGFDVSGKNEDSFSSWLRSGHLWCVGIDLAVCLALIYLALQSLWSGRDEVPGSAAMVLLIAMLVLLCILPICSEGILARGSRLRDGRIRRKPRKPEADHKKTSA